MSSYAKANLIEGEEIIYDGHRHWMVFAVPIFWVAMTLLFVIEFPAMSRLAFIPLIIAIATAGAAFVNFTMTEIVVTNMRVLIKIGWISRQSMETMLQNVASIQVSQGFWGRLLGYGAVTVEDTGHANLSISVVDEPLAFREAVQTQISERFPSPTKPLEGVEPEAAAKAEGVKTASPTVTTAPETPEPEVQG